MLISHILKAIYRIVLIASLSILNTACDNSEKAQSSIDAGDISQPSFTQENPIESDMSDAANRAQNLSDIEKSSYSEKTPNLAKTPDSEKLSSNEQAFSSTNINYQNHIQPILNKRCVVCHGCYDAPCQLKLSSVDGLLRGANPKRVYNGTRLLAAPLTRLYIDAQTTAQWQEKGFYSILSNNGKPNTSKILFADLINNHSNKKNQADIKPPIPNASLKDSLLAKFIDLKTKRPLVAKSNEKLSDKNFDFSLNRDQSCPNNNEFEEYANDYPFAGMPYGLVDILPHEKQLLNHWLAQGAKVERANIDTQKFTEVIANWERFFNGSDKKSQLVARYIYEHLFLANIYFEASSKPQYFKLVRSFTPPGKPIQQVATRRPFDDPRLDPKSANKVERIYYRFRVLPEVVVAKNHIPYLLNDAKLKRWNALFFDTRYQVNSLPNYDPATSANPFKTFGQLPEISRYRFMLEHSKFTIRGFMKGAVCRGQVALNVINDHFWVIFVNPEQPIFKSLYEQIPHHIENLDLPAELQSNAGLLAHWTKYSKQQANYLKLKSGHFASSQLINKPSLSWIWDGDLKNPNAALTVFRHFDSASVVHGFVGNEPKTIWLIDYPILERIHYLLVAGFDVYGNVGHQLATRMYMDFLRMESEFNYLALLPAKERVKLRDFWYRDARKSVKDYVYGNYAHLSAEPEIDYPSDIEPKKYLNQQIKMHLRDSLIDKHRLNGDDKITQALKALQKNPRNNVSLMPESGLLMITLDKKLKSLFSMLRTSSHSNITSLFLEKNNRLPDEDYLTITPGITGAYPDAIWRVEESDLDAFIRSVNQLKTETDYADLMTRFGVRRSHHEFWTISDQLHDAYQADSPIEYGILDYMRIENR